MASSNRLTEEKTSSSTSPTLMESMCLWRGTRSRTKWCSIPPKNQKIQAVEVRLTHLNPVSKHETWSGKIISS
ncbi:hypothetical protein CgunFtcFv8_027639 [Champsocephalus gunnari]|uniref:Uncharacterized protein n=1 Tax=Champsocephalus gunnari TaxID=52237 RepID=A0AAN8E7Z7_CHAGU|nr:hypothetical protein CgunFtcFv8_027639 [Champsocephalus gunnari]